MAFVMAIGEPRFDLKAKASAPIGHAPRIQAPLPHHLLTELTSRARRSGATDRIAKPTHRRVVALLNKRALPHQQF